MKNYTLNFTSLIKSSSNFYFIIKNIFNSFKPKSITLSIIILFMTGWSSHDLSAQSNQPCDCAQRWENGGSWNPDGSVDDSPPNNAPSKGIIKCASQAGTQSQVAPLSGCTYEQAEFEIDVSGLGCIDPSDGSIISIANPTEGEPVIWFNFDVRAFAGNFDVQINDNSGDNIGWALYLSSEHSDSVSALNTGGSNDGTLLSGLTNTGGCPNLSLVACGGESSNTWNNIPIDPGVFNEPTNWYMAIWDQDADGEVQINNWKGRFGCGSDEYCQFIEVNRTICIDGDNYTVVVDVFGQNGTWTITDSTGVPGVSFVTDPSPLTLTNGSENNPVVQGTVTATYPVGTDYDFSINHISGPGPYFGESCDVTIDTDPGLLPLSVTCPDPVSLGLCSDETTISDAYDDWIAGFSFSNGSNPGMPSSAPALPAFVCGGGISLTYNYSVTDDWCTQECSSTFEVIAATPLSVSCPAPVSLDACSTETQISDAYNTWIAGFSNSGGCNPGPPSVAPALPAFVCGAAVSLTYDYSVTDDCGTQSCSSTFNVAAGTPLSVSCPAPVSLDACSTEMQISDAYNTWIAGFSNAGGCNPGAPSTAPALPAFVCGAAVSLTYDYSVTDDCGTQSCSSTFNVAAGTPLSVSCPAPVSLDACSTEMQISDAYNTWIAGFSNTGSCNPGTPSTAPALPAFVCGAAVSLTYDYSVTDDCGTQSCSSTFNVAAGTPLSVSCPAPVSLDACSTETQISDAYNTWIAGFSNSGGCNPGSPGAAPALPAFVCGAAVSLTYDYSVTDDCGTQSCSSTFNVAAGTPLSVSCPAPVSLDACSTEMQISDAYNTWIAGFSNAGGCNPGPPSAAPALPAFVCGAAVSLTYDYSVTDDCGTQSCSSTFNVAAGTPLSVSCPAPVSLDACSTEMQISDAYNTWIAGFSNAGGCNPGAPSAAPGLPAFVCGAAVSLTYDYSVTDDCGTQSCSSTFNVSAGTPLSVSCPAPVSLDACSTETQISDAYNTWIAGFSNTGGCNPGTPSTAPALPVFVCGAAVSLTYDYSVTDDCGTQSCSSTFNVSAGTPLSVSCPAPVSLDACSTEMQISDAYNTWIAGFSNSGGCNPGPPSTAPALPAFVCGAAVSLTYDYSVTDDCGTQSCSSTFNVAAGTPLSVSCPAPVSLDACSTETQISDAYNTWIAGFSNSGGCNPGAPSAAPALPAFVCGAAVSLTYDYSVTDDCGTQSCSSTFNVAAGTPLSVSCPASVSLDACSTEMQISDAYNTWIAGFSNNGGCNPGSPSAAPALPTFVCGAAVSLTYDYSVTDDCGTQSCSSTFNVATGTPLSVSCPAPVSLDACSTEMQISDAYNTWIAGFSNAGGCNPGAPSAAPALPTFVCGAAVSLTYDYSVTDDCGTQSCSSTFNVAAGTPLSVSCPAPVSLDACSAEMQISDAYNTWIAGFSNAGGCNPGAPSAAPALPAFVCGAAVSLTYDYSVTDDCGTQSCSSTFNVAAGTPLSVSCPAPVSLDACSTETQISDAYNTWIAGFSNSGGCNPGAPSAAPGLPAFVCGAAVSLTYDYSVTDDCGTQSCSSTFNVAAGTPLSVSCPAPVSLDACSTEMQISDAYNTWIAGFSNAGGCNPGAPSAAPALPTFVCGAAVSLTYDYSVTDDCGTQSCSSTFNVAAGTPLSVSCPAPVSLDACSTETQISDAYNTWIAGFSNSGGCNPGSPGAAPALPAFVCGAAVSLTYDYSVTDDCGTQSCSSTFNVAAGTPLSVTCPAPVSLDACSTETQISDAYNTWIAGFSNAGGCNPGAPSAAPALPAFVCGAAVSLTYDYSVTDDCGTQSCSSTFNVAAGTPLSVSCPAPVSLDACSTETQISDAYNTWIAGFSNTGGCNPGAPSAAPALPAFVCGAAVSLTYDYSVTDDCGTQSCSSTFNVAAGTPLSVSCPAPVSLDACSTEMQISDAYNTWIAGFSNTGGCNPGAPSAAPALPTFVCGAAISLTYDYSVTDDCGTQSCSSTFNVAAGTPLSVTCPAPVSLDACSTETQISDAYNTWIAGFSNTGGCNPGAPSAAPALPAFVCGAAVSLTYDYSVTDDCGTQSCSSTFNVAAGTPLSVSCPAPVSLDACSTEMQISDAYNTWIAGFSNTGGCNPGAPSTAPALPAFVCGAAVSLTYDYSVTDDCGTQSCSSTFNVATGTPLSVSCPAPVSLDACSTETQISDAYNTWIAGFSNTGGCNPGAPSAAPALPAFVCGAAVSLTYDYSVTDDCGTQSCSSTFNVAAGTPLSVSCPAPVSLDACSTEMQISDAYNTWIAGFSNTGGCNPGTPSTAPALPAFVCGAAVSLTYDYSVTDDCGTQSCSSTFNVAAGTPLSVSCPAPVSLDACSTEMQISDAYNTWIAGFSNAGGCNPGVPSAAPALPAFVCGAAVSLTYDYSVTDDCGTQSCSSTFNVAAGTPLSVSCSAPVSLNACSTEMQISDAYNTWIAGFSNTGGCNPGAPSTAPALPVFVCGAAVSLTYDYSVTDDTN